MEKYSKIFSAILLIFIFLGWLLVNKDKKEEDNRVGLVLGEEQFKKDKKSSVENNSLPQIDNVKIAEQEIHVPILIYHHIANYAGVESDSMASLCVSWQNFEKQMAYLKLNGYETINLNDYYEARNKTKELPKKPIIITFDDGYEDNYTSAFPILRKYKFTATIFIISRKIHSPGYLTWKEIGIMHRAGMAIGAHTTGHENLNNIFGVAAEKQIKWSKIDLEFAFGSVINYFAYPFGAYNSETIDILKKEGFVGAVTTQPGIATNLSDMFELPRKRVDGRYSNKSGIKYFASLLKN